MFKLNGELFFEFFALPFDRHRNPGEIKGVIFDTNATYSPESVWEMLENKRVSAYGDARRFADYVERGDYVFYYHKGRGIIAAAVVEGPTKKPDQTEWYHDVRPLTAFPAHHTGIRESLSPAEISALLGHGFYWARTTKAPYLSRDESELLLSALRTRLDEA